MIKDPIPNTRLREARSSQGYTQQYVADVVDISKTTYLYYEAGKTRPNRRVASAIATVLNKGVDELFDENSIRGVRKNAAMVNARKRLGMTVKEAAETADIPVIVYEAYEEGRCSPHVRKAIRIARSLQSTVEELFAE